MSYKFKLEKIRGFVFDVDGVFTDGGIVLMPDGNMSRTMNVLDGLAVAQAIKAGYPIGIITGGDDPAVRARMKYLGVTDYFAKSHFKLDHMEEFLLRNNLSAEDVLVMGDDIPDMEMLKMAGLATCPPNAVPDIKEICEYISPIQGGKGCVRDVIEQVLKVQGKWPGESDGQCSV